MRLTAAKSGLKRHRKLRLTQPQGSDIGDSFSMGKVREGSFVSMISDGMGTGQEAKKESRKIIEVMEELLGAGTVSYTHLNNFKEGFS